MQEPLSKYIFYSTLLVTALVNLAAIVYAVSRSYPLNPWESALIVDAFRVAAEQPVYTAPEVDPATWMYGPLSPYLVGTVFRVIGPNNFTGRGMSLVAACLLFFLLAKWTTQGQRPANFWWALCALLTVHTPTCAYLTDARPDLPSALFGTLFLAGYYTTIEHGRSGMTLPSLACLIIAALFKQTALMLCVIPAVAVLVDSVARVRRSWILLLLPILSAMILVGTIRLIAPLTFHYMFEIPRTFPIGFPVKTLRLFWILYTPLFVAVWCARYFRSPGPATDKMRALVDVRHRWISCTVVVTGIASLIMACKQGGDLNSFLVPWLAMIAYCTLHLPLLGNALATAASRRQASLLWSLVLSALIGGTIVAGFPKTSRFAWTLHNGDSNYEALI